MQPPEWPILNTPVCQTATHSYEVTSEENVISIAILFKLLGYFASDALENIAGLGEV